MESLQAVADATLAYHKKKAASVHPFPGQTERPLPGVHTGGSTNLRKAGCDKPFKTVAEGVTEYMAWLNRDAPKNKHENIGGKVRRVGDMMMSQSLYRTPRARYPQRLSTYGASLVPSVSRMPE